MGDYVLCAVIGLIAGAIGGWLASRRGAAVPDSPATEHLSARTLTLMDDKRKPRALLRLLNGDATLLLTTEEGGSRARLAVGEQGSFLQFTEQDVVFRLGVGILQDGSPGLQLADPDGTVRASLSLGSDGAVSLSLKDASGKVRGSFDVPSEGNPALVLLDGNGNILAKLP